MNASDQILQIREIIINSPLFPIIKDLAFKNNFPKIFKQELKGLFNDRSKSHDLLTNFQQSPHVKKVLKDNLYSILELFIQSAEEAYVTKESFIQFVNNNIVDESKSIEENNKALEKCKNILTMLGIFSSEIKPIKKQHADYIKTIKDNSFNSVAWNKSKTAKFIEVSRPTIYNWYLKEKEKIDNGDAGIIFINNSGNILLSKFHDYLKINQPDKYKIFKEKWDSQAI